uniref:Glycosyltransferase AglD n=1 Tax=Candidatus Methanophagaceae archaeon ANME-1 ERB6 TaxID=2759912 RepID=A0A7G9Z0E9_9EURY|nr:hypothetical protein ONPGGGGH_00032 [Methanosarcinales archaeon ANME-1 ERB6]
MHINGKKTKILPLVIGIAIVLILLFKIGIEDTFFLILQINPFYFWLSFLLMLSIIILKAVRHAIIGSKIQSEPFTLIKISFVGQLLNLINIGASELSKAYLFKKIFKVPFGMAAVPSVVERFTDIIVITLFALVGLILHFNFPYVVFAVPPLLFIGIYLFIKFPIGPLKKISHDFTEGCELVGLKTSVGCIFFSFIIWLIEVTTVYLILLGLGCTPLIYMEVLGVVAVSFVVSTSIHLNIGGLESCLIFFFALIGISTETALACSLIYRGIVVMQVAILGTYGLHTLFHTDEDKMVVEE